MSPHNSMLHGRVDTEIMWQPAGTVTRNRMTAAVPEALIRRLRAEA